VGGGGGGRRAAEFRSKMRKNRNNKVATEKKSNVYFIPENFESSGSPLDVGTRNAVPGAAKRKGGGKGRVKRKQGPKGTQLKKDKRELVRLNLFSRG